MAVTAEYRITTKQAVPVLYESAPPVFHDGFFIFFPGKYRKYPASRETV
jgi:hypothetical protein